MLHPQGASSRALHLGWPFKALSIAFTLLGSSGSKAAVLGKAGLNHACPWEMSEPFLRLSTEDIKLSFWKLSSFSPPSDFKNRQTVLISLHRGAN